MKIDKKKYSLILLVILILQLIVMTAYGFSKAGFHQDEYYSYFSSNRSLGFYYPDREWVDNQTILDEFVAKSGEGFNYPLVSQVQSWDVHPPLFYDLLHTVCSVTPGVFSKWQGLIVNLIAFFISFVLLNKLAKSVGMTKDLRLVLMAVYGFNPMTISCVLFIRMYMWLTVFIMAYAYMHIRFISVIKEYYEGSELKGFVLSKPFDKHFHKRFVRFLIGITIVNFLGFLTQYYYVVFMAVLGFFFVLWFLFLMPKNKKFKGQDTFDVAKMLGDEEFKNQAATFFERFKYIFIYVVVSGVSLALAVLAYPASLAHIFRGYRGQEAMSAFSDAGNFFERLGFFLGLAGKYLFSGLWVIILALVILATIALFFFIRIKGEKDSLHIAHIRILSISVIAYFVIVAKTALLLGDTSNRYQMPVYPLALLLLVYFVRIGLRAIVGDRKAAGFSIPVMVTLLIFLIIDIKGLCIDQNVLFLYREDADRIAYASEMASSGAKTVVMFNEKTPDNIWRLTDELMEYPDLFYVDESNIEDISDEEVKNADSILVYAADHDNRDALLDKLMACNDKLENCEEVSTKDMWTLYRLY